MGLKNPFKKIGKAVKKTVKKTGNAAKKVGSAVKKTAKKTGSAVKNVAKSSGNAVKKVGSAVKKTAKTTGRVVKNAAKSSGSTVRRGVRKTGSAIKKTAKATGRIVKNVAKKVTKTGNFNLNCHFLICHSQASFSDEQVENWINERVLLAEKLYAMKPKLKIKSSFSRVKNGNEFLKMEFSSNKKYNAFMNKKFDNISKYFTSGRLNFLVADEWKVEGEVSCGKAFFNYYLGWRKHAVYLQKDCNTTTFSHEMGHIFDLQHTFKKGGLCTSKYPKREGGTSKNGRSNIMDYDIGDNVVYLNDCQERVAALRRRRYMTLTGKTKYYKLAGLV